MESRKSKDTCPICNSDSTNIDGKVDTWLQCDACPQWYHANCLNITKVSSINKFFCTNCEPTRGPTTCKYFNLKLELNTVLINVK